MIMTMSPEPTKKEGNTQNDTQNRELYKSKPNERKKSKLAVISHVEQIVVD